MVPPAVPVTVHAAVSDALSNGISVANGGDNAPGDTNATCTDTTADPQPNSLIHTIVNFFSLIVGAVSIIMIIYGGFKYITSGGDSAGVTAAKNTILYAIIGLIIVALSQLIVRFILSRITTIGLS